MSKTIQLLILDVDGVLTDGKVYLSADGDEQKCFYVQDGMGMVNLIRADIPIAIISGRSSGSVTRRMQELGVKHVFQGIENKLPVFEQLIKKLNISADQVAYVGDDTPDLSIMLHVGYKIAVANAVAEVRSIADWITQRNGGEGAVREVCDWILSNNND
ncbi:MAG: HAD-IIIA family hydrolase [Coxiellaceae bacterium]|nr:HAD-IIIA family hydrolase [Coxiellaceae bacterium]